MLRREEFLLRHANDREPPSQPTPSWREYRRLNVFLRPYTERLAVILGISLLSTLLGLAQPYISKFLIDGALLRKDSSALWRAAALMFGATVLGYALNILSSYQYVRVSAAMLFDMRLALYRHLQTLSPRFYAKWRLGDLVSRLNTDIGEVQRVSADSLLSVLSNVVFLAGSIGMMLWLNWKLFLVSVVLVPLCLYTFAHYQHKLTVLTKELRERGADVGSLFVETLIGIRSVMSTNAGEYEARASGSAITGLSTGSCGCNWCVVFIGRVAGRNLDDIDFVFLYGGKMIIEGRMTIGTLVAFMAYHARLLSPVQNLMGLSANLASTRVSLRRIFEVLDTQAEVVEKPGAIALAPIRRGIVFQEVFLPV